MTNQSTGEVFLFAGDRRPFRARAWGRSGVKHLKASVRISSPTTPPSEPERQVYAVRERQAVTIDLSTQNEEWDLTFTNVSASSTISFERVMLGTDTIFNATTNTTTYVQRYRLRRSREVNVDDADGLRSLLRTSFPGPFRCREVSVAQHGTAALNGTVSYRVSIGCVPRTSDANRNNITATLVTSGLVASPPGSAIGVHWGLTQLPTLRASGYFCLGFDSIDRACINARETSTSRIQSALQSLPGVTEARVTLLGQFNTRKNSGNHVIGTYDIDFLVPRGVNLPELRVVNG